MDGRVKQFYWEELKAKAEGGKKQMMFFE